jgi:Right handed beta helix region
MFRLKHGLSLCLPLVLLMSTSAAKAATLYVNCGGKVGLTSIGAALKALQHSEEHGRSTIKVSGACNENVVIQSTDRLTLTGLPGASITDASGGSLDTVQIADSRSVIVNNFTINGGAEGIDCVDGSLCRLNGNTIQGAADAGVIVGAIDAAVITGGVLENNGYGLRVVNGGRAKAQDMTIQNNTVGGVEIRSGSAVNTNATIMNNGGSGMFVTHNGTLTCLGCNVTGNAILGIILRRNSTARFFGGSVITGNTGGGVLLTEESSAIFAGPSNVTGNAGGFDVACGASAATAKLATTNIGGGTTNCVEPVDP